MAISRRVEEQALRLGLSLTVEQKRELEGLTEDKQSFKLLEYLPSNLARELREQNKKEVRTTIEELKKQYADVASAIDSSLAGVSNVIELRTEKFNVDKEKLNSAFINMIKGSEEQVAYYTQRIATSMKEGNFNDVLNFVDDMEQQVRTRKVRLEEEIRETDRKMYAAPTGSPERIELERKLASLREESVGFTDEVRDGELQTLNILKSETEELKKQSELRKKEADIVKDLEERQKALRDFAGDTTGHFRQMYAALSPGASNSPGSIFSSMASQMVLVNQGVGGFGEKMKSLGSFLGNSFSKTLLDTKFAISGFFDYVYSQSIGKAFEFSKMFAEVNKQTGGFGNISQNVVMGGSTGGMGNLATKTGMAGYGIGVQELNKSVAELQNNFKNFNNMSLSTQQSLTVMSAKMENLGVATSQSAKLMETFSSAFGKTVEGASKMMESMARDAQGLGIAVNKYFQEFEGVMSKISGFAEKADVIFKKLSAISLATRLSTDEIAGMSEKFKTLEGAAETVSGLNAALGGTSLRATELIQINPADAFLRIKEELDASGKRFEDLNIGFQRYLANAAGFNDVNAAAKGFNSTLEDIRANMNKNKSSQEDLEKAQQRSAAFQDKYKKLLENVTILVTPIIEAFTALVNGINWINDKSGGFLLPLTVKFGLFYFAIKRVWSGLALLVKGVASGATAAVAGITRATAASTEAATAATTGAERAVVAVDAEVLAYERLAVAMTEAAAAARAIPAAGTVVAPATAVPATTVPTTTAASPTPVPPPVAPRMGMAKWGGLAALGISVGLMAAAAMTSPKDKTNTVSSAVEASSMGDEPIREAGDLKRNKDGTIVLAPEGAFQLSPNDEFMAAPNIGKAVNSSSTKQIKEVSENIKKIDSKFTDVRVGQVLSDSKFSSISTIASSVSTIAEKQSQDRDDMKKLIAQKTELTLNMPDVHLDGEKVGKMVVPKGFKYAMDSTENQRLLSNQVNDEKLYRMA